MSTARPELGRLRSQMLDGRATRNSRIGADGHRNGVDRWPEVNSELPLMVALERVVDERVEARLAELAERLSDRIAAELAERLAATGTVLPAGSGWLLTIAETAKLLSISRSTVYDLIRRGELASVCVGAARRVTPEALAAFRDSLGAGGGRRSDASTGSGRAPAA